MAVAIREQYTAGFTIIDLGYGQLVASETTPGTWWLVEGSHCTCPAFEHGSGPCKHLKAVAALPQTEDRAALVARFNELEAANPGGDFIKLAKQAGDDVAAQVADARMTAPASFAVPKEEML